ALPVGVLDAQAEGALVVPGEQPVEQRRAAAADVQESGGGRGEANDDGHGCCSLALETAGGGRQRALFSMWPIVRSIRAAAPRRQAGHAAPVPVVRGMEY